MGPHSGEVWQGVVCPGDKGTCRGSLDSLRGCGNRDFIGPGRGKGVVGEGASSGVWFGSNGGKDRAGTERGDLERGG